MPVVRKQGPGRPLFDAAIASLRGRVGRVGWFSSSLYPNGLPVAYIASIHEFGYPAGGIPPRMGLRGMVVARRAEWSEKSYTLAKRVFSGKLDGYGLLMGMGLVAEGDIKKQITSVTSPELKEATLAARARNLARGSTITPVKGATKRSGELTITGSKPLVEPIMSKANQYGPGGLLLATVSFDVTFSYNVHNVIGA
jgi:hypothetical protein